MTDEEAQEHFDNFFEDVFVECEDKVRNQAQIAYFLSKVTYNNILLVWRD